MISIDWESPSGTITMSMGYMALSISAGRTADLITSACTKVTEVTHSSTLGPALSMKLQRWRGPTRSPRR